MGRSQETFGKKEIRKKKEKKRLEKEKKRLARKESEKKGSLDDMIAFVDENGMITSTPPDPNKRKSSNPDEIEVSVPRKTPEEKADTIRSGTLTFFNENKGYGFIETSDTGQSIFVHVNEFQDDILKGDQVTFETERGVRGLSAIKVKLSK
jgi:cold shock CspA family protein